MTCRNQLLRVKGGARSKAIVTVLIASAWLGSSSDTICRSVYRIHAVVLPARRVEREQEEERSIQSDRNEQKTRHP